MTGIMFCVSNKWDIIKKHNFSAVKKRKENLCVNRNVWPIKVNERGKIV